jgi:formylmethanofuran dehydrogenase subunit E
LDIRTGEAVRLSSKRREQPPEGAEGADLVAFFDAIPDEVMFYVRPVKVHFCEDDLPGKPRSEPVRCPVCGERVIDGRHVIKDGTAMCKACANGAYYEFVDDPALAGSGGL